MSTVPNEGHAAPHTLHLDTQQDTDPLHLAAALWSTILKHDREVWEAI